MVMEVLRPRRALLSVVCLLLYAVTARATSQSEGGPAPTFLRNVAGTLFFATYRGDAGGWQVWKSDGTPNGRRC